MKTYSVLMAWHDHDREQGDYGAIVRAEDSDDAIRQTRRLMWSSDLYHDGDPVETPPDAELELKYGRVIECEEGAIWKASDLEEALRGVIAMADAASPMAFPVGLTNALEVARQLLASIEEPTA